MKVKLKLNGGLIPTKATDYSVCFDLYAKLDALEKIKSYNCISSKNEDVNKNQMFINPGGRCLIPTGLNIEVPMGYEAVVRPRSGMAINAGISIVNSPGTIDSDYRGDIGIILINHGVEPFVISHKDRIAQLAIRKTEDVEWEIVNELEETTRSDGGFGSTGSK